MFSTRVYNLQLNQLIELINRDQWKRWRGPIRFERVDRLSMLWMVFFLRSVVISCSVPELYSCDFPLRVLYTLLSSTKSAPDKICLLANLMPCITDIQEYKPLPS